MSAKGPLPCSGCVLLAALACSCAATRRPVVAVAPVEAIGLPAREGEAVSALLQREVQERAVLADRAAVEQAMPAAEEWQRCLESEACLALLGLKANADLVLAVNLAVLGDAGVIRGRVIDTKEHLVLQELQETVGGDRDQILDGSRQLARRLLPASDTPWYGRWWVWAAGALVVGAAVGAAVILAREDQRPSGAIRLGDL